MCACVYVEREREKRRERGREEGREDICGGERERRKDQVMF